MPELRKDPVVGRWVIIATERARRPSDFAGQPVTPAGGPCVFCEGHEAGTPPEILAGRPRGGGAPARGAPAARGGGGGARAGPPPLAANRAANHPRHGRGGAGGRRPVLGAQGAL